MHIYHIVNGPVVTFN